MFTGGTAPVRTAVAVYSMILNGYVPAEVLLYGEHQWGAEARVLLAAALPFARVVPSTEVLDRIGSLGGSGLVDLAKRNWYVMKACLCLLCPPEEFCAMDDDVFVLDSLGEAVDAFQRHDLVFTPDINHGGDYLAAWGPILGLTQSLGPRDLRTGTFNAGLYWMRNRSDPAQVAVAMLREDYPAEKRPWVWEQGLIATLFAQVAVFALPSQRYFFMLYDGMPGGSLEYDYAQNPCGFASVHFGAVTGPKPSDQEMLALAADILGRSARRCQLDPRHAANCGGEGARSGVHDGGRNRPPCATDATRSPLSVQGQARSLRSPLRYAVLYNW
jgi:hypothetical protein